jgi:hypothetical protein
MRVYGSRRGFWGPVAVEIVWPFCVLSREQITERRNGNEEQTLRSSALRE